MRSASKSPTAGEAEVAEKVEAARLRAEEEAEAARVAAANLAAVAEAEVARVAAGKAAAQDAEAGRLKDEEEMASAETKAPQAGVRLGWWVEQNHIRWQLSPNELLLEYISVNASTAADPDAEAFVDALGAQNIAQQFLHCQNSESNI